MRTFIIHFQDGSVEETQVEDTKDILTKFPDKPISYYEEPQAESKIKNVLDDWIKTKKDEEVELAIVPRVIRVPSAHPTPEHTHYDVIVQPNGDIWCPCTGFANRHYCWHSTHVKELLEEEKKKNG